ncbi:MAG: cyclic pyranopterin monophosphate synthase MoaC [Bacillota bacterium]|nr:cyclic pyranopterin monophosphate synthase MoaC [Bacillota bacterium]
MAEGLTHFDRQGRARMVDVGGKEETERQAVARGWVRLRPETLALVRAGRMAKGDVLGVAQVAGIMAAKRTSELIPMCHPLPLTAVELNFELSEEESAIHIEARVRTIARTGVEMEALTAVAAAALTIYDMCKAVDRSMEIGGIVLWEKTGGKSGTYRRSAEALPAPEEGEDGRIR